LLDSLAVAANESRVSIADASADVFKVSRAIANAPPRWRPLASGCGVAVMICPRHHAPAL